MTVGAGNDRLNAFMATAAGLGARLTDHIKLSFQKRVARAAKLLPGLARIADDDHAAGAVVAKTALDEADAGLRPPWDMARLTVRHTGHPRAVPRYPLGGERGFGDADRARLAGAVDRDDTIKVEMAGLGPFV